MNLFTILHSSKRFARSLSRRTRESGLPAPVGDNDSRDMTSDQPRQTLKNAQECFTYSWPIKNFNELVSFYPSSHFVLSERFWSPRLPSKNPYLWRAKLYPNGVNEQAKAYISLYLVAIQTPYEKSNNITCREKQFRLEVFRLYTDTTTSIQTPVLIRNETFTMKFEFEGLDDFGRHRFCSFDTLFPNGDLNDDVDLLIRIKIFNDIPQECEVPIESDVFEFPTFAEHLNDSRYSDVEFTFDCGNRIKAHRIILATRSKYFEKLLGDKWRESQMKAIAIKQMEYTTFRSVLYYLYTGGLEEDLQFDVLKDVYSKADMLNLEKFGEMIADRIAEMVDLNNWNEVLTLAWEVGDSQLRAAALDFAVANWSDIRDSENMRKIMACGKFYYIEIPIVCYRLFFGLGRVHVIIFGLSFFIIIALSCCR